MKAFVGLSFVLLLAMPLGAAAAGGREALMPGAQSSPTPYPAPTPVPVPSSKPSAAPSATPGVTPAPEGTPLPGGTPAPHGTTPAASPPSAPLPGASPQAYAAFVKGAEKQAGLLTIIKKDDDVYLEIAPEQYERTYMVAPVLAAGANRDAFGGLVYRTFLVKYKRVGKRILWLSPNAHFVAKPGSSAQAALSISVPAESVIASSPIVAEDTQNKHVVISAGFFLTDFENVGASLGGGPGGPSLVFSLIPRPSYALDATRSYIERTKTFPKNVEILANLTFTGSGGSFPTAPDSRSVQVKMHYSIVDLPASEGYIPRYADDRLGYFITAQKRFDHDDLPTPFVRYIERWNLANGPITYYLTKEIPPQYRRPIRQGLLAWNPAFAKAGYPNAVVVKDQPDDPEWDPDDARYTTVRWITSDQPPFGAYGPSFVNPYTGEIFRAEVVFEGETIRGLRRGFVDVVRPTRTYDRAVDLLTNVRPANDLPVEKEPADAESICRALDCDYARESAQSAAFGSLALQLGAAFQRGYSTQRYVEEFLRSITLHESGHNLGLRHNFQSSTIYSLAQLHDKRFTATHGIVGSVMEYTPVNLSPSRRPQGDLFQLALGPYDYWVVQYGYQRVPGAKTSDDERPFLRRIAEQSTRPELAYGTDEDAYGPNAFDPRISTFDLSNDPLAFDRDQFQIAGDLLARLDRTYPRDDRSFYEERLSFATILRGYTRAATLATKYIGGIYTSRAHRGQRGGGPPFAAIPRAEQRRAFALLDQHIFSARAFTFSPKLLNDLGGDRFIHWNNSRTFTDRRDMPVADTVAAIQDGVIDEMFSPATTTRLVDQQFKVGRTSETMSLEDLFAWTGAAVWDSVQGSHGGPIAPLHRALQRRYTDLIIAFALAPSSLINRLGYPPESQALARYQLVRLDPKIVRALHGGRLDLATRAHLEDAHVRISHALEARSIRPI